MWVIWNYFHTSFIEFFFLFPILNIQNSFWFINFSWVNFHRFPFVFWMAKMESSNYGSKNLWYKGEKLPKNRVRENGLVFLSFKITISRQIFLIHFQLKHIFNFFWSQNGKFWAFCCSKFSFLWKNQLNFDLTSHYCFFFPKSCFSKILNSDLRKVEFKKL